MEHSTNRTNTANPCKNTHNCNGRADIVDPIRLVVSVRNLQEAILAKNAAADIIDLKEPSKGSLGAVSNSVACQVKKTIGESSQLSIALGELREMPDQPALEPIEGFQFAKIGLSEVQSENWEKRLHRLIWSSPVGTEIVAVAYADWRTCGAPCPKQVLHFSFENDISAFVLDTYDKSKGDLFDNCSMSELQELADHCRCADLTTVFAGSISPSRFQQVVELQPDYVAARGALCHRDRSKQLAPELLEEFRAGLRERVSHSNSVAVNPERQIENVLK